jgi:hypothetical protein
MDAPLVREYATEAIRYWEPRRVIYNLVLVAVVVAYFVAGYPASKQDLTTDSILVLFLLAVVANVAYCAAYLTLSPFLCRCLAFTNFGGRHAGFCLRSVLLLQRS